jgi:hypothetical protein
MEDNPRGSLMKRKIVASFIGMLTLSGVMSVAQPAAAQDGGCAAFGQNISILATSFGVGFGQTAASTAPLNDTVETEQAAFCG